LKINYYVHSGQILFSMFLIENNYIKKIRLQVVCDLLTAKPYLEVKILTSENPPIFS